MRNIKQVLVCKHCSCEFKPTRVNNKNPQKYCSIKCASDAKRKPKGKCVYCGNEITGDGDKFCSRSCSTSHSNTGRKRTVETREKLSKSAKANPSGFILNPRKGFVPYNKKPLFTLICDECGSGKVLTATDKNLARQYCSDECRRKNTYHPNSTRVKRSMYGGYQMDSGAERYFAKQCDEHEVQWIKNSEQYFLYEFNGKTGKYYPDFYLPEHDLWVEIKGKKYEREGDVNRREAVGNIVLLYSNEFKTNIKPFFEALFVNV